MHYEWVLLQLTECSFTHLSSIGIGESFSFGFSCFSLSAAIFISNVWTCGFGLIVLYVPYISKSFDNCGSNLSTPSLFRSCSKRPYKPSVFWKSESDCSVNECAFSAECFSCLYLWELWSAEYYDFHNYFFHTQMTVDWTGQFASTAPDLWPLDYRWSIFEGRCGYENVRLRQILWNDISLTHCCLLVVPIVQRTAIACSVSSTYMWSYSMHTR